MEDSKLNKRFQGAVRRGGGRVVSGLRGALGKLHVWQKAGLVLCIVSWIVSAVIGAVCSRISGSMTDQNCAARWSPDRESAQVSAFVSGSAEMSDETVQAAYSAFMNTLQEDAIGLSETQIENGASLMDVCYCGIGNAEISVGEEAVNATMIGVGGDFFNFHPLDLMDGYYFSEDELMQDRVLLDDETAWRLFGSSHIVGMQVNIGGTPHYVAGVFRRPTGRFYKYAGMGNYMVFISYDSLCRYTETGSSSGDDSGGTESDMMDARLPASEVKVGGTAVASADRRIEQAVTAAGEAGRPVVPVTASWQPAEAENLRMSDRTGTAGQALREDDTAAVMAAEDEEAAGGTAGSGMESGADTSGTEEEEEAEEGEDESDEDLDKLEPGDTSMNRDTGSSAGKDQDSSEAVEKEEVNRGRINCYEVVMPDPVSGYAVMNVRKCLESAGISPELFTIVENSSRFDTFRLASMVAQPGVRSMQTAAIRYPYWENVALAWEDTMIPYAVLQLLLRYAPFLFLLYLILWYATHKGWTVAGLIENIQDRIYEQQSERIYGKPSAEQISAEETAAGIPTGDIPADEVPGDGTGAGADPTGAIPADGTTAEENVTDELSPEEKVTEKSDSGKDTETE